MAIARASTLLHRLGPLRRRDPSIVGVSAGMEASGNQLALESVRIA